MSLSHKAKVCLLYKTILRLHRGLPAELQPLGNGYARDEFRRHQNCQPAEAQVFLHEWTQYAIDLSKQLGLGLKGKPQTKIGLPLQEKFLDNFNEGQIVQLYELSRAARGEPDDDAIKETTRK